MAHAQNSEVYIFPDIISFDGKKFRTSKQNPIIESFSNIHKNFQGKKKGDNSDFSDLSPSAERGGVELLLRCCKPQTRAANIIHVISPACTSAQNVQDRFEWEDATVKLIKMTIDKFVSE